MILIRLRLCRRLPALLSKAGLQVRLATLLAAFTLVQARLARASQEEMALQIFTTKLHGRDVRSSGIISRLLAFFQAAIKLGGALLVGSIGIWARTLAGAAARNN